MVFIVLLHKLKQTENPRFRLQITFQLMQRITSNFLSALYNDTST